MFFEGVGLIRLFCAKGILGILVELFHKLRDVVVFLDVLDYICKLCNDAVHDDLTCFCSGFRAVSGIMVRETCILPYACVHIVEVADSVKVVTVLCISEFRVYKIRYDGLYHRCLFVAGVLVDRIVHAEGLGLP